MSINDRYSSRSSYSQVSPLTLNLSWPGSAETHEVEDCVDWTWSKDAVGESLPLPARPLRRQWSTRQEAVWEQKRFLRQAVLRGMSERDRAHRNRPGFQGRPGAASSQEYRKLQMLANTSVLWLERESGKRSPAVS